MDYKKAFERFAGESAFIKVTSPCPLESSKKAELNRKGNMLFNSGEIEKARRIFLTTGYSDGISRVGDYYMSKNRMLEALQMYWTAPNRNKLEPLLMQLANVLQGLIRDEEKPKNE